MSTALKVSMSTVASVICKWNLRNRGRRTLVSNATKNPMVTLTEL